MLFIVFILTILLSGCSSLLTEETEHLKVDSTLKETIKRDTDGTLNAEYPQGSSLVVTGSGNAVTTVHMGAPKGTVKLNQAEKVSLDAESEQAFSVDAFLSSVPTWLYVAMLFLSIIAAVVVWIFIKTTVAGRAADKFLGGGLQKLGEVISIGDRYLREADPNSPQYSIISSLMNQVKQIESDESKKTRGNGH